MIRLLHQSPDIADQLHARHAGLRAGSPHADYLRAQRQAAPRHRRADRAHANDADGRSRYPAQLRRSPLRPRTDSDGIEILGMGINGGDRIIGDLLRRDTPATGDERCVEQPVGIEIDPHRRAVDPFQAPRPGCGPAHLRRAPGRRRADQQYVGLVGGAPGRVLGNVDQHGSGRVAGEAPVEIRLHLAGDDQGHGLNSPAPRDRRQSGWCRSAANGYGCTARRDNGAPADYGG